MGKYEDFNELMFDDIEASSAERSTVYLLSAIANELAELNEFLRERMPKPISCEEFDEMMRLTKKV